MTDLSLDRRLQNVFRALDNEAEPEMVRSSISALNNHLKRYGLSLRECEIAAPARVETMSEMLDKFERSKEAWGTYQSTLHILLDQRRRVEIERDVLSSFVSPRVREIAALQAKNLYEQAKAGQPIDSEWGQPAWSKGKHQRPIFPWPL